MIWYVPEIFEFGSIKLDRNAEKVQEDVDEKSKIHWKANLQQNLQTLFFNFTSVRD